MNETQTAQVGLEDSDSSTHEVLQDAVGRVKSIVSAGLMNSRSWQ
jgi:hypothetical protein